MRYWRALMASVRRLLRSARDDPGYAAWACLTCVFVSGVAAIVAIAGLLLYVILRIKTTR